MMTPYISAILRYYRANMAFVVGAGCICIMLHAREVGIYLGARDCIAAQGYDTLPT